MSGVPGKAVFLSYASQDAEMARGIADALQAAGLEVWFDQSELRGGDAWDQKIRSQIRDCALFIPVITANTNARPEGYFRLEWKLAVDRSHLIADDEPFLLPIAANDVDQATARVPDRFRDVQWTRVGAGQALGDIAARLRAILAGEISPGNPSRESPPHRAREKRWRWWMAFPVAAAAVAGLLYAFAPHIKPPAPPSATAPAQSEARKLADRAHVMAVDKFASTADDYTAAEPLMKRALAMDPEDGEILARAAQLNIMFRNRGFDFSQERIATGRQQAERAIRMAPQSAEAEYALYLAHNYTGNAPAAEEAARRALEKDPRHARALLSLGFKLNERGQVAESRALYDRARQQPPWAPLVDYFQFIEEFRDRNFQEADRLIRSSHAASPSTNSAAGIALVHLTWKGDLDEAARELAAVPATLLNATRVAWVTVQVHMHRRAPDEALKAIDRLSEDFIQDSWFIGPKALLVGRAHALAGRKSAARIAWENALAVVDAKLKATPADAILHRCRGEILASLGRTEEALAEARTVAEINRSPRQSWWRSEATIYAALGRADLAVPMLEKMMQGPAPWPLTPALLRHDPLWDRVRGDARFKALQSPAPAGLPAASPEAWRRAGRIDRRKSASARRLNSRTGAAHRRTPCHRR